MPITDAGRSFAVRWTGAQTLPRLGPVPADPVQMPPGPIPVFEPQVASRIMFDANGRLARLTVAGRPTAKHDGNQGQHTTAYAVTREAIFAALPAGCDADQGQDRLARLFDLLTSFPGVRDKLQDGSDYAARLNAMSDPATWPPGMSIDAALRLYTEMRDAIPGATLAGETHGDTTGGAESAAITGLRNFEIASGRYLAAEAQAQAAAAAAVPDAVDTADDDDAAWVLDQMRQLIDLGAISKLDHADRVAQVEVFLRSMAQAFPVAFLSEFQGATIGDALVTGFAAALTPDGTEMPFADTLANDCAAAATAMLPPEGSERMAGQSFLAMLTPDAAGQFSITFEGRPESTKDGGSQGNHLTSFRTVSRSIGAALLDNGRVPDAATLAANAAALAGAFDPAHYAPLIQDFVDSRNRLAEDDESELSTDQFLDLIRAQMADPGLRDDFYTGIMSREGAVVLTRLCNMKAAHRAFLDSVADLGTGSAGAAPVDPDTLLDISEMALALIDDRPTSMIANSLPGGHGEGEYGRQLDALERAGTPVDSAAALDLLCRQLDKQAVHSITELFQQPGTGGYNAGESGRPRRARKLPLKAREAAAYAQGESAAGSISVAAFQDLAIADFCWFAQTGYPNVVGQLTQGGMPLVDLVKEALYGPGTTAEAAQRGGAAAAAAGAARATGDDGAPTDMPTDPDPAAGTGAGMRKRKSLGEAAAAQAAGPATADAGAAAEPPEPRDERPGKRARKASAAGSSAGTDDDGGEISVDDVPPDDTDGSPRSD